MWPRAKREASLRKTFRWPCPFSFSFLQLRRTQWDALTCTDLRTTSFLLNKYQIKKSKTMMKQHFIIGGGQLIHFLHLTRFSGSINCDLSSVSQTVVTPTRGAWRTERCRVQCVQHAGVMKGQLCSSLSCITSESIHKVWGSYYRLALLKWSACWG